MAATRKNPGRAGPATGNRVEVGPETAPGRSSEEYAWLTRIGYTDPEEMVSASSAPPPPPRWPMVSGIFLFPWYPQTLGPWMGMSFGLGLTGFLLLVLLGPAMQLGLLGLRLFLPPVCAAGVLAFGYAAACCLNTIEETLYGWDSIETWPDVDCFLRGNHRAAGRLGGADLGGVAGIAMVDAALFGPRLGGRDADIRPPDRPAGKRHCRIRR